MYVQSIPGASINGALSTAIPGLPAGLAHLAAHYGDLAGYRAVEREPIRADYHGIGIVTAPPPSSGGIVLAEALKILEGYDLDRVGDLTALSRCRDRPVLACAGPRKLAQ